MENNNILDEETIVRNPNSHNTGIVDNSARAKQVIVFLWISVVIALVMFISDFAQYNLLEQLGNGTASYEEADANDVRQGLIAIIYLGTAIATGIIFIRWFRRAYHNLSRAGLNTEFSEGWAAGAWFVPFMNLGRPYKIMKEIWEGTLVLLDRIKPGHADYIEGKTLIGFWWFCWIVDSVFSQISSRMAWNSSDIDTLMTSTALGMVSSLFSIAAGLLIITVVKKISAVENEVYEHQSAPRGITV
jgi:hypothetical protein